VKEQGCDGSVPQFPFVWPVLWSPLFFLYPGGQLPQVSVHHRQNQCHYQEWGTGSCPLLGRGMVQAQEFTAVCLHVFPVV